MKFYRVILGLALAVAASSTSSATVMAPMYMDDLTSVSQTVVLGTITASRAEWNSARNMIFTIYTVIPAQYLKGGLGAAFELREPGGEIGDEGMRFASVPWFKVGQEAVLFVWTDPAGQHQVAAFEQGAVSVAADPATGAKVAARAIPLGSAAASKAAPELVDSDGPSATVASATAVTNIRQAPAVTYSSTSLDVLMNQIRMSVARSQPVLAGE